MKNVFACIKQSHKQYKQFISWKIFLAEKILQYLKLIKELWVTKKQFYMIPGSNKQLMILKIQSPFFFYHFTPFPKFPTHDLILQDSGKFVTMFQRISVFHILFFHNTCIPYMIGEITFILIFEASKKINYFECKGEKCVLYIHLKKTKG